MITGLSLQALMVGTGGALKLKDWLGTKEDTPDGKPDGEKLGRGGASEGNPLGIPDGKTLGMPDGMPDGKPLGTPDGTPEGRSLDVI